MLNRKMMMPFTILTFFIILLLLLSSIPYFIPRCNSWAEIDTQINKLHELDFDGSGVTIGIIDTGLDISHHEFDNSSISMWKDFINNRVNIYDDDGHGTHITGILISKGSYEGYFSGINLKGISNGAKLIVVKSIPEYIHIFDNRINFSLVESITYCIDNGADIILLSIHNGPIDYNINDKIKITEMINIAVNKGIFVVAPAGNDGQNDDGDVSFPTSIDNVIAVGAISKRNSIMPFSSKGHQYPG